LSEKLADSPANEKLLFVNGYFGYQHKNSQRTLWSDS